MHIVRYRFVEFSVKEENGHQQMKQSSAMPKENPPTLVVGSSQGMKERGFSLGCQPKDGLLGLSDKVSDKYYDIIE